MFQRLRINEIAIMSESDSWQENIGSVMKLVNVVLKEIGLIEIPTLNEIFNENYHECVEVIEDKTRRQYEIVKVYKKGYLYNNKVVRHATVAAVK